MFQKEGGGVTLWSENRKKKRTLAKVGVENRRISDTLRKKRNSFPNGTKACSYTENPRKAPRCAVQTKLSYDPTVKLKSRGKYQIHAEPAMTLDTTKEHEMEALIHWELEHKIQTKTLWPVKFSKASWEMPTSSNENQVKNVSGIDTH